MLLSQFQYPISITYRFILAFVIGYICANYLALNLTLLFQYQLASAEAVYLSAFICIIFFTVFVIYSFIIQSLKKLSILSFSILLALYALSKILG